MGVKSAIWRPSYETTAGAVQGQGSDDFTRVAAREGGEEAGRKGQKDLQI